MRNNFPLASALALCGLLASCDDGRYLVGILGQGKNGPMGGSGAGGAGGTTGGAGGAGGAGGTVMPPPPATCAAEPRPLPVRALTIPTSQVAERLARLLFADRPDAALLARTESLRTSADVQALTRELFRDGRARGGVHALADSWLRLEDIRNYAGAAVVRNEITPELRTSMQEETRRFVEHLFFGSDGLLRTLLTAPFSFVDQRLATLYGIGAPANPWSLVMLDPQQRSGMLSQVGVLFAHPRASSRGTWVRRAFLCQVVPAPPDGLDEPNLSQPVPNQTSRQRLEAATRSQAVCNGCHNLMDPPGYAFEHYDPLGRWRETENGVPVSSAGHLTDLPQGGSYLFGGAPDLGQALAGDCSVQVCAVQTFLQQGLGGSLRMGDDDQSVRELWAAFAATGFDLRELLIAITGSEAFLSP
jgi:hypothetical protein